MKKMRILLVLSILLTAFFAKAQKGCTIEVELENYKEQQVRLAYYFGDQLYIQDSIKVNKKGIFEYKSKFPLHPGMYAIVLAPDNRGLEFLANVYDQKFKIKADADDLSSTMRFEGSIDNTLFLDYIQMLGELRPIVDSLRKESQVLREAEKATEALEKQLEEINNKVEAYKANVLENHPKTLTAAILRSQEPIEYPEFKGTDQEIGLQQFFYKRDHYFDLIRQDTAFFRTKAFDGMVNFYMEKLVIAHPDSIIKGVDEVLTVIEPDKPLFRYYFIKFINNFGKMKMIGHDAVYVHMVEEYCLKNRTPFLPEEELKKAKKRAESAKVTLIGKLAPNIAMLNFDIEGTIERKNEENEHKRFKVNDTIALHDVKSPYTVLFFWKPNCPACKKAVPKLVEFYEKYKEKGVEIYACPTKTYKDLPKCAEFLKANKATEWINAVDPYYKTKFMTVYHIESTPRIYILNDKKEIIMNRIGAEQLGEVMDGIINKIKD